MSNFNKEQIDKLKKPILKENVKTREAFGTGVLSYIPGHIAIDTANDIFGFDGWSTEILSLKEINRQSYIKPPYKHGDKEKPMISIAYLCTMRLTVGDSIHEDTGFGDGVAGDTPSGMSAAIELASKEAVTDAIKRCLRAFGNQFGNSLYDKDAEAPIDQESYEASKVIEDEQLNEILSLLEARNVDEEWALAWLKGEGWDKPLDKLRMDWYQALYNAVDKIGEDDRKAESYEADIKNIIKLMDESVNMNMLKGLFAEGWRKATGSEDKESQKQLQEKYEEKKVEFE